MYNFCYCRVVGASCQTKEKTTYQEREGLCYEGDEGERDFGETDRGFRPLGIIQITLF